MPFPPESPLSGIEREDQLGWYRETFTVPAAWQGQHVQLNFGAVAWQARVYVNGQLAGTHQGDYDSFSLDITRYLKPDGPNELVVGYYDPIGALGRAGRQADRRRAARDLPHGIERDLADGVARAGSGRAHRRTRSGPRPRSQPPVGHRRYRGRHRRPAGRAGARGAQRRRDRERAAGADAGAQDPEPARLVPLRSVPVRTPCPARELDREGRRRQLLRHALDHARQVRWRHEDPAERQVRVRDRGARPGLLARRPLHAARRRRDPLGHPRRQGARLRHAARARQGPARPLVLLGRQARHPRVAGHAEHADDLRRRADRRAGG